MEQLRKWNWKFPTEENFEKWNESFSQIELDCNSVLYTVFERGVFYHVITSDMEAIKMFNYQFEYENEDDSMHAEMIECETHADCAIALDKFYN